MDELILKALTGRATDLEAHRLEQWRRASAANERAWREAQALWAMMDVAVPAAASAPPSVDVVVEAAEARRRRGAARLRGRRLLRSPWLGWGLAAAAVAALALAGIGRGPRAPENPLAPTASSTMVGDVVTMSLSDGSVVRMAASSHLRFPRRADGREVELEGRAFFAVAAGEVPFVVRTAAGDVTVHGTRFEVSVDGDALRLVVVDGAVDLAGRRGGARVEAGQVAFLSRGGVPRVVAREDVWSLLDWPAGLLLFQATPLAEAGREIARRFGRPVEVDPALAQRRVTAWFEDESLDEVVSAVCLVAGAACEVGADAVRVRAR